MDHTCLRVTCPPDFSEILMAEMADAGFDTFLETEHGFEAYAVEGGIDVEQLNFIKSKYGHVQPLLFSQDKIKKQNWNEEWEKNVTPVVVDEQCLIRAEFHKIEKSYPYEIIITPKMSFGTGHHQTTYLMIKAQLQIDHQGKLIMDAGCGTAILSIMASKRGARQVESFDIDDWSIENGNENAARNACLNINIHKGTIEDFVWQENFDIILANINKNVLLREMKSYSGKLKNAGLLLLSGFYEHDIDDLLQVARPVGLEAMDQDVREGWASLLLRKTPNN